MQEEGSGDLHHGCVWWATSRRDQGNFQPECATSSIA